MISGDERTPRTTAADWLNPSPPLPFTESTTSRDRVDTFRIQIHRRRVVKQDPRIRCRRAEYPLTRARFTCL